MIGRYRTKYATKEGSDEPSNGVGYRFIGRELVEKILAQEGCVGIRSYFAETEDGKRDLVMVGANQEENDIVQIIADRQGGRPPDKPVDGRGGLSPLARCIRAGESSG